MGNSQMTSHEIRNNHIIANQGMGYQKSLHLLYNSLLQVRYKSTVSEVCSKKKKKLLKHKTDVQIFNCYLIFVLGNAEKGLS